MKNKKYTNKIIYCCIAITIITLNTNTFSFFKSINDLDKLSNLNHNQLEKIKKTAIKIDPNLKGKISNLKCGKDLSEALREYFLIETIKDKKRQKNKCIFKKLVKEKWQEADELNTLINNNKNAQSDSQNKDQKNILIKILNDYIVFQNINKEIRLKGSVILADLEFNKKNYKKAKNLINYCLYIEQKKDYNAYYIAEAYMINAKIYKKLINMLENSDDIIDQERDRLSKLNKKITKNIENKLGKKINTNELINIYLKKIAACQERAKKYFELSLNIATNLKLDAEKINFCTEKMLNAALEAGSSIIKYYSITNKNISDKKKEIYLDTSKKLLTEIINYNSYTQAISAQIILIKIIARINLAKLSIKSEDKDKGLIKNIIKDAIDSMNKNNDILKEKYPKETLQSAIKEINLLTFNYAQ